MPTKNSISAYDLLAIAPGDRIAVVGCGGKTSLISSLAKRPPPQRVLISPTTHIRHPGGDAIVCESSKACLAHIPRPGVQYMGVLNPKTQKLASLPLSQLQAICPLYHLVLMEADGSRGLPCKGWLPNEPVVPSFATATLGVANLDAIGLPADNSTVLRLPRFLALTGLSAGELITPRAISSMISAPNGMFKGSVGRRLLALNGAESPKALQNARCIASLLRSQSADISLIIAGSARQNHWVLI